MMDPAPEVAGEIASIFQESGELFLKLLRRACPQMSTAEFHWRANCILGAQVFSLVYGECIGKVVGTKAEVGDGFASQWSLNALVGTMSAAPSPFRTGLR